MQLLHAAYMKMIHLIIFKIKDVNINFLFFFLHLDKILQNDFLEHKSSEVKKHLFFSGLSEEEKERKANREKDKGNEVRDMYNLTEKKSFLFF